MTAGSSTTSGVTVLHGETRALTAESVVERIRGVVLRRPDLIAVQAGDTRWRFAELWQHTEGIAAALVDCGVAPGDRVGIWADRTAHTVAAMLAVMAIRATYVPLDPAYPPQRVQAILDGAGLSLMLHDATSPTARPPHPGPSVLDVSSVPPSAPGRPLGAGPKGADIAYVIYTSGSTGQPKGVQIEHRSLANYAQWCASAVGDAGVGTPLFGSLGFDHSLTSLWPTLVRGQRVVVAGGVWDRAALFANPSGRYTFIKVTPSHLRFFERTGKPSYRDGMHLLMSGGEALETGLLAGLGDRVAGLRMINHYGPTETTIGCVYHEFDPARLPALPTVPIGRPIWNTRAYLVDSGLRPARPGKPAELVIAGLGVAAGYVGDVGSERFIDEAALGGPPGRAYRTGDIVDLLADGTLLYVGRGDDQVKVSGYRIELGELRRHALAVDGVAEAAFEVMPGEGDTVEAFVVPRAGADPHGLGSTVRRALALALPPPAVPRRVHIVAQLAVNVHGKVDLAATRRRLPSAPTSTASSGRSTPSEGSQQ